MKAIYGATQVNGRPVIIGYINPNVLADTGETRLYSTNAAGVLKNYLWLKNDGTIEIGGSDDFMVRFSKLKEVTDELQNDLTTLKNVFSTWTPVSNDGGAALKLAAATWYGTPISKDINEAKIAEIKTS